MKAVRVFTSAKSVALERMKALPWNAVIGTVRLITATLLVCAAIACAQWPIETALPVQTSLYAHTDMNASPESPSTAGRSKKARSNPISEKP